MKSSEVMMLLKKSAGENPYKSWVPSLKREVSFRPLTAGMQKTISRVAIADASFSMGDYQLTQLACIKALCLEQIKEEELTDLDFLAILAGIRLNNKFEPMSLTRTCPCGVKTSFTLDCAQLIEQLKSYEERPEVFEKDGFSFELNSPRIVDVINFQMLDEMISSDDKFKNIDADKMRIANYPIQFIKSISINGDMIENYSTLKFNEKIELIDVFTPNIVYGEGETLTKFVLEKFSPDRLDKFYQKVICPNCSSSKEGAVSTANFFTL